MLNKVKRLIKSLRRDSSGNVLLIMALGMPVFVGGAGLAVDTAQWYMWQREIQFAVDQAALAGAWARSDAATQSTYVNRATQEFDINLSTTDGITSTPTVTLLSYGTGSNNAVEVYATASKPLPFSNFITGNVTTVSAKAKATFTPTASYTACILSVNPTENRSAIFGNAITGGSDCGVGALSTGDQAIVETGDSEVALGDIIAAGGVEETFSNNGTIHENVTGLSDPHAGVAEPSSVGQLEYSYSCPSPSSGTTIWVADVTVRTEISYLYRRGNPVSSATPITLTVGQEGYLAPSDDTAGPTSTRYSSAPTAGSTTVGPNTGAYSHVAGTGTNRIWRAQVSTVTTTIGPVTGPITAGSSDGRARPLPGVYADINITCDTVFSSGIYFISGSIDFGNNHIVTGSDVMFVMTGVSSDIRINSTSNVSLSGITPATLESRYGYSAADAAKLNKMLFFDKENYSDFDINGNATLDLDGIIYMPSREVMINGNMSTGTRCIMLVADTFTITGSANLTNFCNPAGGGGLEIGNRPASVRLVA